MMRDYVNEEPNEETMKRQRKKKNRETNQAERRLYCLIFLIFGVLCITQAILNLTLRLTFHSDKNSETSGCDTTQLSGENTKIEVEIDCEHIKPAQCRRLQEKSSALIRDVNLLERSNSQHLNVIKRVEEERDKLKFKLNELSGCVSSGRCPPEWREINSKCYFLSTERKTWEESRKQCQSKGADLVVISNEQEQNAIYRLDGNPGLLFWIGLHNTYGTFKWVDGSELKNTFWQDGQPDHGLKNEEDCVEMFHQSPALASWNDVSCLTHRHWLCEKDLCFSL